MRSVKRVFVATSLAILAACASGGGGDSDTEYDRSLGRITYRTLAEGVDKIFRKYTIPIYRQEEQYATVYIESEWISREPFESEVAQGAVAARSRFVINGRRSSGPVFRTTITVENQVRTESYPEWRALPVTSDFTDWAREIVSDLEAEVRTGIR